MIYDWLKEKYKDILIKDLAKEIASTQNKKYDNGTLEYRFVDSKGRKYYGFPGELELPVDRYLNLMVYARWLAANVTKEELGKTIAKANEIIEQGVQRMANGKRANMIKLGAIINDIGTRNEMIIDPQIIYNIICVQLVREDEEPGVFNEKIHQQKVQQCMNETQEGNNFFLQTLEYKRLIDYSVMSPQDWVKYLKESTRIHKELQKKIQTI